MSSFVLIHGGAHGAWCWEKMLPHLLDAPEVESVWPVDLVECVEEIADKALQEITNEDYIAGVVHKIETLDMQSIVLVGHSQAGLIIPGIVAQTAQRIQRVIYIATSNPPAGQSLMELMQHPLSPLSRNATYEEMFCNDLDEETAQWLMSHLREDPVKPLTEPVQITGLPDGVPSTYVVLEQDRALLPEFQQEQAQAAAVDEVVRFDAGHSAFASKPEELAQLLLQYA